MDPVYDWKVTLFKTLRAAGVALAVSALGALVTTLTDTSFVGMLGDAVKLLLDKVPYVGSWAAGFVIAALNVGVTAVVVAVNNIIKHLKG